MAEDFSFRVKNTLVVNNAFVANSSVMTLGANVTVNTTSYSVVNSTVSAVVNTVHYFVGNSVTSAFVNSSASFVGNSSVNAVANSTSITFNSTIPQAITLIKPTANGSTYVFAAGSNNASSPFWNGLHIVAPGAVFTNATSGSAFPRTSHYYSFTNTTNPSDLTYNIVAGNDSGIGTAVRIYSSSRTTGSQGIDIAANGFVGVGTTSPGTKLDIYDAAGGGNPAVRIRDNVSDLRLYPSGGASFVATITNTALIFNTNNSERLRISEGGNIGIGTGAPATRLDVYGGVVTSGGGGSQGRYLGRSATDTNVMDFGVATGTGFGDSIGIYNLTSTGLIAFGTNNTERMRILNNGNVGIGTSSPGTRLHSVTGDTFSTAIFSGASFGVRTGSIAGSGALIEGVDPTGVTSYQPLLVGGSELRFTTSGTERMRLNSSGNLGIGTISPGVRLEVAAVSSTANATWAGGTDFVRLFAASGSSFSEQAISFQETGTNVGAKIGVKNRGNGAYDIIFANRDGSSTTSTMTERMRIAAGGNVGVGTAAPGKRLSVNGDLGIAYGSGIAFNVSGESSYTADLAITNFWNGSADQLRIQPSGASGGIITFHTGAAAAERTERMRIDASGNIGIGTLSPTFNGVTGTVCHINNGAASSWAISHYTNGTTGAAAADGLIVGLVGDGSNAYVFNYEAADLLFGTSGTERVRINSTGNVGIGTVSPLGRLHVAGGRALFGPASEIYALQIAFNQTRVNSGQAYYIGATDSATPDMVFSDSGGLERMRVSANGNIGVGNTAPAHRLRVEGTLSLSGALHANGSVGTAGQVLVSNGAGTYWGSSTVSVRQTFTATAGQTTFTVSGGYTPNQVDVYYNGAKLINGTEVTVTSGTNVVLSSGAAAGATVDVVGLTATSISFVDAVAKSGDTMSGTLNLPSNGLNVGSTQLVVTGGNVGIGTSTPASRLDVNGVISQGGVPIVPPGVMLEYGGSAAPSGWLLCDGAAVNRIAFAALFAIIGTTYGAGDGVNTFNVPDRRGRYGIGANATYPRGTTGGSLSTSAVALTTAQMPSHTHTGTTSTNGQHSHNIQTSMHDAGTSTAADGGGTTANASTDPAGAHNHTFTTDATGGGQAHDHTILPPYVSSNYIIKT